MTTFTHHPVHSVAHEIHYLHTVEQEGESAATPLIAIGELALFLFSLLFLVIGVCYGLAYLVTGAFL